MTNSQSFKIAVGSIIPVRLDAGGYIADDTHIVHPSEAIYVVEEHLTDPAPGDIYLLTLAKNTRWKVQVPRIGLENHINKLLNSGAPEEPSDTAARYFEAELFPKTPRVRPITQPPPPAWFLDDSEPSPDKNPATDAIKESQIKRILASLAELKFGQFRFTSDPFGYVSTNGTDYTSLEGCVAFAGNFEFKSAKDPLFIEIAHAVFNRHNEKFERNRPSPSP